MPLGNICYFKTVLQIAPMNASQVLTQPAVYSLHFTSSEFISEFIYLQLHTRRKMMSLSKVGCGTATVQ